MRRSFASLMSRVMRQNERIVLLLGDIGVHAMKDAAETGRVFNCGIREQAMVNMASGLAAEGFYPICHTIEPFLCERALEQIKVMAYNRFRGAFVTCGGSYDYASLGSTHHCPAGPANMLTIPGMKVYTPGSAMEAEFCIADAILQWQLAYIRLIDGDQGPVDQPMRLRDQRRAAAPAIITTGTLGRLIPPDLQYSWWVTLECLNEDYIAKALRGIDATKFLVVEEFYSGTITDAVAKAMRPKPVLIQSLGVPREFINDYGDKAHIERLIGLTPENISKMMEALANA